MSDLQSKLQTLQNNLILTLGQLEFLKEQRQVIREEIAKVQGQIEATPKVEQLTETK
jgi:peptidoglycan hydrolase CwlO-like protein